MVSKFTNRFANVFLQIYLSHLRLKGYADEYGITEKDFQVKLNTNNLLFCHSKYFGFKFISFSVSV
jgi:hypothetical protein